MNSVAVLGCGSIGRRHITNLRSLGQYPIYVYDPDPEAITAVAGTADVAAFGDLANVWFEQPDAVLICTPSNLHVPQAIAAAQHGCHVFVEKPLSPSVAGLDELQHSLCERGLVSLVGCNMRFHPGPAQIKQWLEAGIVGEILAARIQTGSYLPLWRPHQDYRTSYSASPVWGGAVLDCVHELDLALWLLGPAELRAAVTRRATSIGLQTDGIAEVMLEHASGAVSSVHLNFVQRNYRRCIQVIGSEGTIEWDFVAGEVVRYGPEGRPVERIKQAADWQTNQMYIDELRHFLTCVESRTDTCNPVALAAETLELALAIREENGRWL